MSNEGMGEVSDKEIQEFLMNLLVKSDLEVITLRSINKSLEMHFEDRGDLHMKQRPRLVSKTLNLFIESKALEAAGGDELFNDDIEFDDDDIEIPRSDIKAKNANAFTRPVQLSNELSEFMGTFLSSRTAVVKKLWDYIKSKGLQNPLDKREILCDSTLEKVFKRKKMTMFSMNKYLAVHIKSIDDLTEQKVVKIGKSNEVIKKNEEKQQKLDDIRKKKDAISEKIREKQRERAKEKEKAKKNKEKDSTKAIKKEIKKEIQELEAKEKKLDNKIAKKLKELEKKEEDLIAKAKADKAKLKEKLKEKVEAEKEKLKGKVEAEKEKLKGKAELEKEKLKEKIKAEMEKAMIKKEAIVTAKLAKKGKKKRPRSENANGEDGSEPLEKKPRGPGPGKGLNKPMNISNELAEFLGVAQESRPQVVSKLWAYIRANNLQNPAKKSEIFLDATLKKLFHVDMMTMFSMNKLLSPHFMGAASMDGDAEVQ